MLESRKLLHAIGTLLVLAASSATACSTSAVQEECKILHQVEDACLAYGCDVEINLDAETNVSGKLERDTVPNASVDDQITCRLACTNCGSTSPAIEPSASGGSTDHGGSGGAPSQASGGTGGTNITGGSAGASASDGSDAAAGAALGKPPSVEEGRLYAACRNQGADPSVCDVGVPVLGDGAVCVCTKDCLLPEECPPTPVGLGQPYCLVAPSGPTGSGPFKGFCFSECNAANLPGNCADGLSCKRFKDADLCFAAAAGS